MKSLLFVLLAAVGVHFAFAAPTPPVTTTTTTTTTTTATTTTAGESDTVWVMRRTMFLGQLDQFMVVMGVSPCMASCVIGLKNKMNATETDDNDNDNMANFDEVCDSYLEAAKCFDKCKDVDDHLFEVFSSGAEFMCIEQRQTFERAMPCIREQKKAMKQECRRKCSPDVTTTTVMTTTTVTGATNSSDSNWDEDESGEEIFSQIGDVCTVLHCSMECGRDYLNEKCDKDLHAGSLLTEVVLRPLEKNAELMTMTSPDMIENVKDAMPDSCSFIVDLKELNELRGPTNFFGNNSTSIPIAIDASKAPIAETALSSQKLANDINARSRRSPSSSPFVLASAISAADSMSKYYV